MARLIDDFGGEGGTPARLPASIPAPAPAAAPAPAPVAWSNSPINLSGLPAALATQAPGGDGRNVLTGAGLLSLFNPIKAPTYVAPRTWMQAMGDSGDVVTVNDGGYFLSSNGTRLASSDGRTFTDTYDNPTGSSHDKAQVTYTVANGVATPVSAVNDFARGWWTDWGQTAAAILGTVLTAGAAGAYFGAGAAATEAGAGAVGGAATVDAGVGALTIDGATASGFGSGLGIDGFGAGLGSTLSTTATPEIFGSLGAWGTAAPIAADLTFAGQGISLGSSLASSVQQAVSSVSNAVPSSTPAAAAPAAIDAGVGTGGWTLPSAGQALSSIGAAAGVVGSVAGAANAVEQLQNGGQPSSSSGTATPAQQAAAAQTRAWLLILAGAAGVYLIARK